MHPTYGFRTETTPSLYCWTKETHDGYGSCSSYYTSLNGAEYSSTDHESKSLSELPDGTNVFSVYGVDMYGNSYLVVCGNKQKNTRPLPLTS